MWVCSSSKAWGDQHARDSLVIMRRTGGETLRKSFLFFLSCFGRNGVDKVKGC